MTEFALTAQEPDGTVLTRQRHPVRLQWSFDPSSFFKKPCCNRFEGSEVFRVGSRVLRDTMRRRDFIKVIVGMPAAWPIAVRAQTYPSRPVTMVIPFAAGGGFDIMGRILAARMSEILGQHSSRTRPVPQALSE